MSTKPSTASRVPSHPQPWCEMAGAPAFRWPPTRTVGQRKLAAQASHTHINTFAAKSFTHCSSPVPAAHAAPPAGSSAVAASTTGALAVAAFNLRAARCWMAALLHQMPLKSVAAHPAPNHGISHAREFISTRAVRCSSSNRHAKPCAAATQWVAGARGRRPDSSGGGRHSFLRARGRPTPRQSARRLAAVTATTYVPTLASARTRAIAKVLCRAMPLWIARGWNKLMHALHGNGPPLNPNAPPFVPSRYGSAGHRPRAARRLRAPRPPTVYT